MARSALSLFVAILATLLVSFSAQAQIIFPGACTLAPSSCELRGKILDTERCRCVRPIVSFPGSCGLVPSFCELHGKTLDTDQCKCVRRSAAAPCGLAPFFCEIN